MASVMCSLACCNKPDSQEVIKEDAAAPVLEPLDSIGKASSTIPPKAATGVEPSEPLVTNARPDPEAKTEPDPQPGLFLVKLDRRATGEQSLGIDILANDHVINILKVTGGMMKKWNETNPSMQVCAGDLIPKVNGVKGDLQLMRDMISKADTLELVIQKESTPKMGLATAIAKMTSTGTPISDSNTASQSGLLLVRLDRNTEGEQKIGLDITAKDHIIGIERVKGGMMKKWNETNPSDQVCAGDSILKVNGVQGDLQLMLRVIKQADTLEIVIRRARDS